MRAKMRGKEHRRDEQQQVHVMHAVHAPHHAACIPLQHPLAHALPGRSMHAHAQARTSREGWRRCWSAFMGASGVRGWQARVGTCFSASWRSCSRTAMALSFAASAVSLVLTCSLSASSSCCCSALVCSSSCTHTPTRTHAHGYIHASRFQERAKPKLSILCQRCAR